MISTLLKVAASAVLLLYATHSNAQNGLNFDGTDYVQTTYSGVTGTNARTFEAWVYVSSSAPASNLAILDYGLNAVGSRNTFNVTGSRGLSFISGGTNANIGSPINAVPEDQWTHVAFVLNSGTGYLYVNGIEVGTGNLTTVNTPTGNGNVRIGERVSGGTIPFYGSIDEVRVWDVARTPAELLASMNAEMCSLSPNLQLYCRFNQGVAGGTNTGVTSLIDDSGNANNGTLTGFALTGATSNWVTGVALTPGFSSSTLVEGACDNYTWAANATMYTTSGVYSEVLAGANAEGCDSIVSLDLTIYTANDLSTNVTDCDSYTWPVNGQTYTSSATVVEPQVTGQGCPYNHTLNLTLGQSNAGSNSVTACTEYFWSATGITYTTSGTYDLTLTNSTGCDSVATLNLTITNVDNTVTDNGDGSYTANQGTASYQWLYCDSNFAVVPSAFGQTFVPTENGSYAVRIISNNCTDTSDCITVDYIGLEEIPFASLEVKPNPTSGKTTLSFGAVQGAVSIQVRAISGQLVEQIDAVNTDEITIDITGPAGVYLVQVQGGSGARRTLRVIKN